MKFSTNSKVTTALIAAFIFSISLASQASASTMTWLSSITDAQVPARIALDAKGNVYVTEPRGSNRLLIFNGQGTLVKTLRKGLHEPKGIAVDADSRIYVGNEGTGSVDVFNPDLSPAFSLGSGKGEFKLPSCIVVTSAGTSYVVDGEANTVKAYDAKGSSLFSFGTWGRGNGKFNDPMSIAIDEAQNELYVTDRGIFDDASYGAMGGARVQVFDLNGNFLRSFGQFGSAAGQMKMPQGIAADGNGNLYITDSNLGAVHVFTTTGAWIETISDNVHILKTPIGIAIGKDKRAFVASSNGSSLEVYGLPGFTTMQADRKTLNFSAIAGGANPGSQTVTITNSGSGVLDWTTKTTTTDRNTWLAATASGSAAASGSSAVAVSVNASALGVGTYTGTIAVTSATGAEEVISVNLAVSVPPAILTVDRTAVSFKGQQNGPDPLPQIVNIKNAGTGAMAWSAQSSAAWLKLGPSAATNTLTMSPSSTGLLPGVYAGTITITASGAQGSPLAVSVSLVVAAEGTLKIACNVANASFEITGPAVYSGSGASWKNDAVIPGDYTVSFKRLPGFVKPAARKVTVRTGQETSVNGDYRKKLVPSHVIAGSAHGDARVSILPLAGGSAPRTFSPFTGDAASVRVAALDVEGSSNLIVVTDSKRSLKVFTDRGNLLASHTLDGYNHADVVVGDIDGDGKADILLSGSNDTSRIIEVLSYGTNTLQEKAALFSEEKSGRFSVALGDVNDDGVMEVVIADATSIRAFSVQMNGNGLSLGQLWNKTVDYSNEVQVVTADLNGDGIAEIIVSHDRRGKSNNDGSSVISALKGTGDEYGLSFEPFKDLAFDKPSSLCAGDIDGDGADEIIAGADRAQNNDQVIKIFESDGTYAGFMKPMNEKTGVNVGFGSFQAN